MRVALADDSELFRTGLAALLNASGIQVVLQAGSGHELLDQLSTDRLDAVILDIRMPPTFGEEGLDTADELGVLHPDLAVLVLSTYAETAYAARVFHRGSARRGYLLKDALGDPDALRRALERLRGGGAVLDRSIVQRLMSSTRRKDALGKLTGRQRKILHLLAQGYPDADIAQAVELDELATRGDIGITLRELGILLHDHSDRLIAVLTWLRSEPAR